MDPVMTCLENLYYLYEKLSKNLKELKILHWLLKEICELDIEKVKPHLAKDARQICHKLEALENLLEKYVLYMQYFDIITDTAKKTDKPSFESKQHQLQKLMFYSLYIWHLQDH